MDRKRQNIITDLSDLQKNLQDFKGSQPIGGASFVNYDSVGSANGGLYDFAFAQSAFKKGHRVTFTHSQPGKLHIVRMSAFFRLDNGNVMAAPYLTNVSRAAQLDVVPEAPVNGQNTFLITTENFDWQSTAHTFYVKLFFKGTTDGTFSVADVF